jgi:hypothetical protein
VFIVNLLILLFWQKGCFKSQNPLTAKNAKIFRKARKGFNMLLLALRPLRLHFATFAVKKTF